MYGLKGNGRVAEYQMDGDLVESPVEAYDRYNQNTAKDLVDSPISNVTAATNGAGALTGTYYYCVAFITKSGVTGPWTGTPNAVVTSANQVLVTNIPLGDSTVIGRVLYRTVANSTEPKDYKYLTTILDNVTTAYIDNVSDAGLGLAANWQCSNRSQIFDGDYRIFAAGGQSLAVGRDAMKTNVGYANVALGYQSMYNCTSGRRNTAGGIYSLTSITSGYENAAWGTHAGQYITTQPGNTLIGCMAGFNVGTGAGSGWFNTAVGRGALNGTASGVGNQNVAIGLNALANINTADGCVGIGAFAGQFANASRQLFIDTGGSSRINLAAQQNAGLIYGKAEATAAAQVLYFNAMTRIGPPNLTVANLPTASAALQGCRAFVTDATSTTFNAAAAGGGSNKIGVVCDGTSWKIG